MKLSPVKQFVMIALLLSLSIAVTIRFPGVMSYIFADDDYTRQRHGFIPDFAHLAGDILITALVALLMFTLNFFILKPLEKHTKINVVRIVAAIFLTIASVYILNDLFHSVLDLRHNGHREGGRPEEFDFINFFVSGLVIASVLFVRLIFLKQNMELENESLRREALQSQFESLKNQLSPHFLFNSLTALQILIREEPDKAQEYVNSLSKALRYTLKSNEKQLVRLDEEMEFMDSYLFLIRIRYGDNLAIRTKLDDRLLDHLLPPLTIQTLVENAIKHNEISRRKPLIIEIITSEDEGLAVSNDIQQKLTGAEGTGIGLTNLSRQFSLLVDKDISIRREENKFIVEVPLIKPGNGSTDR